MPKLVIGEPNERQKLFLSADKKYVGFGGSRGGGKSWAIRTKAVLLCLKHAGIKVMIVRKTYPELQENHIMPMIEMLHCYDNDKSKRIASYNDSKKNITFPNGSRILFRYCDNDKDAERFQGTEVDVLFIDEATHQTEERMKKLTACVRGVNNFPKRIYMTMNPGSVGHQWVKRLFIDKKYTEYENPDDYLFIQSRVTDNKALIKSDPDYIKQLEALPPKLRDAWLYGDWNIFDGQYFEEFKDDPEHYLDRQWTHVIEPFEIPDSWTIYRGFDWGYNHPFSCGWWAIDPDGVMYRILELYGCTKTPNEGVKWIPQKVFEEIHRIECEHRWLKGKKIIGIADPAIWNAEYGESIAETASKNMVYFSKGDHERLAGWMQMHYRMAFDENGYPMMYIFKNCKGFIRTIPQLMYDEHKVEDIDTDGEDHIADETRYVCMSRPIKPRVAKAPDTYRLTPQSMFLDIQKEDIIAKPKRQRMEVIDG